MQLENQVDCSFSYNASQIPLDDVISVDFNKVPLNTVLEAVTGKKLEYVARGRHLMFMEKTAENIPKYEKKEYIIEGTVRNARTGEVVNQATIYAVGNKYSALSNESGYYRLQVNSDAEVVGLSYSKQSFFDTLIVVQPVPGAITQDIRLVPRESPIRKMTVKEVSLPLERREVEQLAMVRILVPEKQTQRAINLEFLEQIPIQFSLIPSVGTNKLTSGISENSLSINLLGGYNAGLNGFEAGGGINILRKDARGLQAGAVGNIVGGEVKGIQAAGVFNNVRGSVNGLQAAGVHNIVLDTIRGLQAAGAFNVLRGSIMGSQLAGVFNIATQNMSGLQGAGVFNITYRDVKFGQAAGVFNVARNVSGAQIAGALNVASDGVMGAQVAGAMNMASGDMTGMQVAGAMNMAEDVLGSQIAGALNIGKTVNAQVSGFINVARKVEGVQIGVLNFADSSGMAIGFLSFSFKGYNHIDISADEVFPFNLGYRTGNRHFYNIIQFGYGSYYGYNLFSWGYGLGTEVLTKKERLRWNIDLLARQIADFNNPQKPFNLDCMFNPQLSVRLGKKTPYIVLGPALHFFMYQGSIIGTSPLDLEGQLQLRDNYPPMFDTTRGGTEFTMWPGGKIGMRF